MAMIKSALEIALERSKDIKMDEAALEANALRVEGKKGAGRYLDDPDVGILGGEARSVSEGKAGLGPTRECSRSSRRRYSFPINDASAAKLDILSAGFSALAIERGRGPPRRRRLGGRPTRGCKPSSSSSPASSSNTWTI